MRDISEIFTTQGQAREIYQLKLTQSNDRDNNNNNNLVLQWNRIFTNEVYGLKHRSSTEIWKTHKQNNNDNNKNST